MSVFFKVERKSISMSRILMVWSGERRVRYGIKVCLICVYSI